MSGDWRAMRPFLKVPNCSESRGSKYPRAGCPSMAGNGSGQKRPSASALAKQTETAITMPMAVATATAHDAAALANLAPLLSPLAEVAQGGQQPSAQVPAGYRCSAPENGGPVWLSGIGGQSHRRNSSLVRQATHDPGPPPQPERASPEMDVTRVARCAAA